MSSLKTIEDKLAELFKNAPSMSENGKDTLVKVWPWIALIFGALQVLAAWGLWELTRFTSDLLITGLTAAPSGIDKTFIYLGIIVLLIDGVILLMAFSPLSRHERRGWDLLFAGALLNLAYSVISIFINERGVPSFIFSLIASAIAFYLLFQVRDKYKGINSPRVPKITNKSNHS